ncbi:tetratricopeptide repeat-containing sulfotransferase family protein [Tahibacter amnicola]|uniref:Sulfotransferase n=1 Tax=Tahibacter amnicola TaxID=2976241 RepID=A0ABY6BC53_9GAMM|nr:sulfotransferase [Tahibacter amnicola]UXI67623.1 sulfotransferase [Tahibacter amnicola]
MPSVALPDILNLIHAGRHAEAERHARAHLAAGSNREEALFLLAVAQHQQGQLDDAIDSYRTLTELRPGSAEHWSNYATALRESRRFDEAHAAYEKALALSPRDAALRVNVGLLHMEQCHYARARELFLEAMRLDPRLPDARIFGAMMCYEFGDTVGTEQLIHGWQQWPPLDGELAVDLASILASSADTDSAEKILQRCLGNTATRTRALVQMALLQERLNRLDQARATLAQLPSPADVADTSLRDDILHVHSVIAARSDDLSAARSLLEALAEKIHIEQKRTSTYFELGRICDKLGDYDAAMQYLGRAHAGQMLTVREVDPKLADPDAQPLKTSLYWVSPEQFAAWPADSAPPAAASPIFVVGFPRSGTTMLEQMLDAHPSMQSMDERPFIQMLVESMQDTGLVYPDQLGALTQTQCDALRARYDRLVASVTPLKPGQRIVDKNPLNLLRLPMIRRVFPSAKIILALRHPCDVLTSCYMQTFRAPSFGALCSSLERLAQGYVNAMRFWLHHAALLQPDVMVLRYEDLIDQFDTHVARLGQFLELDDPTPLTQFHQHARSKGYISTPSYSQVVNPPNRKAIGRWRRYEKYFEPVLPVLDPIMREWGYDV